MKDEGYENILHAFYGAKIPHHTSQSFPSRKRTQSTNITMALHQKLQLLSAPP